MACGMFKLISPQLDESHSRLKQKQQRSEIGNDEEDSETGMLTISFSGCSGETGHLSLAHQKKAISHSGSH